MLITLFNILSYWSSEKLAKLPRITPPPSSRTKIQTSSCLTQECKPLFKLMNICCSLWSVKIVKRESKGRLAEIGSFTQKHIGLFVIVKYKFDVPWEAKEKVILSPRATHTFGSKRKKAPGFSWKTRRANTVL